MNNCCCGTSVLPVSLPCCCPWGMVAVFYASHTLPVPRDTPGLYGLSRGWLCLSSTAAPLLDPLVPLGQARCWGTQECCSSLVATVKPSHWCFLSCPVIPFLSPTLRFHSKCCFAARVVSGAATRRQGWWVLPSLPGLSGGWWNGISRLRGPVPLQSVFFPGPFLHSLWWQMRGLSHQCRGSGWLEAASCTPPAPFQLQSCQKSFPKTHHIIDVLLFPHNTWICCQAAPEGTGGACSCPGLWVHLGAPAALNGEKQVFPWRLFNLNICFNI